MGDDDVLPRLGWQVPCGNRQSIRGRGDDGDTRRIGDLEGKVAGADVIDPPSGGDRVTFGSTVRLQDEAGKEVRYWIVGSDEAEPARGYISVLSPLARTLIAKHVGDIVTAQLPGGRKTFEILEVNFAWTE